jgi:hypothetical protein
MLRDVRGSFVYDLGLAYNFLVLRSNRSLRNRTDGLAGDENGSLQRQE